MMIIRNIMSIPCFLRSSIGLSTTLYFFFALLSGRRRGHNKVRRRSESQFFIVAEYRNQSALRIIYLYVECRLAKTKVQLWSEL